MNEPSDREGARALIAWALLVILGVMAYFRFKNPDMTSMRYVMTYWPLYLVAIIGVALYTMLGRVK